MSDAPVNLERVACALCGADDTRLRHHKFNLDVVQCNRCRLVYTNPRLAKSELFTRYSENYFWDEYMRGLEIGRDGHVDLDRFAVHHRPLLHFFDMYHPPPGRLVEVGAAAGLFMKSAERAGSLEDASFEDASFDAAVMFETIEHLQDPIGVLRGIRRLLRQRGLLVMTTPNWEAFSRHALGPQWAIISPAEHLYYFSEATLTAALKQAGFSWIHYHRDFASRAVETMNADYTHAPGSLRHRLYQTFVRTIGPGVFRSIQKRGLADQLVCVARA